MPEDTRDSSNERKLLSFIKTTSLRAALLGFAAATCKRLKDG
jgi:hypothetical protein